MSKYYKASQCADLLNVSSVTALRLAKKYDCTVKIGTRNIRIDYEKLMTCLEGGLKNAEGN